MCDSTLHRVTEIHDATSVVAVDLHGTSHLVSLLALDGEVPSLGAWLVVHSGYAIDRVTEHEAKVAFDELFRATGSGGLCDPEGLKIRESRATGDDEIEAKGTREEL